MVLAVAWWSRTRRPLSLVATLVTLCLFAAGKLALLFAAGLQPGFGVMHVLYLDLVIVVPVGGIALLALGPRRTLIRVMAAGAVLLAPIGAYASWVEPNRIEVERAEVGVPRERTGREPVTVGVLADIQFRRVGEHERRAVSRLMRERPDVIVLPGDIHQGSRASLERTLPQLRALLRRLRAPGGVYFVLGDAEGLAKARRELAGTGVRLLHDQTVTARVRDRRLTIGGIRRNWRSGTARRTIDTLESAPGGGDIRLLLAHRPDAVMTLRRDTRVDLVAAGHTHGGQVRLPLIGPPVVATDVPRRVAAGGLHTLGGRRRIYVSRGVGLERGQAPPVRFGVPPELSILRLR